MIDYIIKKEDNATLPAASPAKEDCIRNFQKSLVASGAKIHRAENSKEHNGIIHALLFNNGAYSVVKSSSLLMEEFETTFYLQQHGFIVTETGLEDRIIQLWDNQPFDPLNTNDLYDVGQIAARLGDLFGVDKDDPEALGEALKKDIDAKIFRADAYICEADLGVADTGSCFVFNPDGTAEMCASHTRLHIVTISEDNIIPETEEMDEIEKAAREMTDNDSIPHLTRFTGPRQDSQLHVIITRWD